MSKKKPTTPSNEQVVLACLLKHLASNEPDAIQRMRFLPLFTQALLATGSACNLYEPEELLTLPTQTEKDVATGYFMSELNKARAEVAAMKEELLAEQAKRQQLQMRLARIITLAKE